MSRLIFKGDTISNFGKNLPVPYIERIELRQAMGQDDPRELWLPDDLAAFVERKKAQTVRSMPTGSEDKVSTSKVIEGLIAFWRAMEVDVDNQHKDSVQKQGEEGDTTSDTEE